MYKDVCQRFVTKAREHERIPKNRYRALEADDTTVWYDTIHHHFVNDLLPHLKQVGELFIEYWPIRFIADREAALEKGLISNDFHTSKYGTYGTGYVCLTNPNLYISNSKFDFDPVRCGSVMVSVEAG